MALSYVVPVIVTGPNGLSTPSASLSRFAPIMEPVRNAGPARFNQCSRAMAWMGIALAIATGGATGCASAPERHYVDEPHLSTVVVTVVWVDPTKPRQGCLKPGLDGCASIGTKEKPFSIIYAVRPRNFSDTERLSVLGEELLHALGAKHD
jgi:hypothetical protein